MAKKKKKGLGGLKNGKKAGRIALTVLASVATSFGQDQLNRKAAFMKPKPGSKYNIPRAIGAVAGVAAGVAGAMLTDNEYLEAVALGVATGSGTIIGEDASLALGGLGAADGNAPYASLYDSDSTGSIEPSEPTQIGNVGNQVTQPTVID